MSKIKTISIEIERQLLFSVFKYQNQVFGDLKDQLEINDFASPINRKIFSTINDIVRRGEDIPSLPAIANLISAENGFDDKDKVMLDDATAAIKKAGIQIHDVPHLTRKLKEMGASRRMMRAFETKFLVEVENGSDVEGAIGSMISEANVIKKTLEIDSTDTVMRYVGDADKREAHYREVINNPNSAGMVQYGFKNFDKFLPALAPGDFIVYQARTGTGKSMFLMGTAVHNHAIKGLKVLIITIEMSAMQYATRLDSHHTGFQHKEFSTGSITNDPVLLKDWKSKIELLGKQNDSDLMIYWVPVNCTPNKVDAIIEKNPFKPDLVIVDYAGDMKAGLKGVPEYSAAAQAEIYSRLKELAGKHRCVLITAQQTKRGAGKKIDVEDGAWTAVASNKSDVMISIQTTSEDELHEEEHDGEVITGRVSISIIKGRNIPQLKTIVLPRFSRMGWIEKETDEPMFAKGGERKTEKKKVEESGNKLEKQIAETPKKEVESSPFDLDDVPTPTVEKTYDDNELLNALSEI